MFTIFGGLIVFDDRFLRMWWEDGKESELDKRMFPGKSGYYFNRYGRGLGGLTLGVMMLVAFVITLSTPH
jgi:hypothetical protein